VVPLALYFLWARKDRFPGAAKGVAWGGLILVAASIGMRVFSARFFMAAIDGWSMILWVGGVVWIFWGRRVFWWSLPSIAFLWFMVPLPYRVERWLSLPLQRVATKLSCWTLQLLGQPALGQGNTIHLGEHQLEVEQACSGLRIFVGIVALAFAYVIIVRRPWWEKALLLVSVVPIALVANATRIVGMGLLCQLVSGEAGKRFAHDFSGWVMIPFAAGLFALVLWYLGKLVQEVEQVDVAASIRRQRI
jgi:exosortase